MKVFPKLTPAQDSVLCLINGCGPGGNLSSWRLAFFTGSGCNLHLYFMWHFYLFIKQSSGSLSCLSCDSWYRFFGCPSKIDSTFWLFLIYWCRSRLMRLLFLSWWVLSLTVVIRCVGFNSSLGLHWIEKGNVIHQRTVPIWHSGLCHIGQLLWQCIHNQT